MTRDARNHRIYDPSEVDFIRRCYGKRQEASIFPGPAPMSPMAHAIDDVIAAAAQHAVERAAEASIAEVLRYGEFLPLLMCAQLIDIMVTKKPEAQSP